MDQAEEIRLLKRYLASPPRPAGMFGLYCLGQVYQIRDINGETVIRFRGLDTLREFIEKLEAAQAKPSRHLSHSFQRKRAVGS